MEEACRTQLEALEELNRVAPDAPFLALGQTVFWDEPVKAMVALASRRFGSQRKFLAGVHDTDYFAKFASRTRQSGFAALPHNDTTTKGLWSAAGEFSALFGSETVITRDLMQASGAKIARVAAERPGSLDDLTEAWGWRGVVSFSARQKTTSEKPLGPLFPALFDAFEWAIGQSLELISGPHRKDSEAMAQRLLQLICDESAVCEGMTLGRFYQRLLPKLYDLTAGESVDVEATATTELLSYTLETCDLPRFQLLAYFLDPATRPVAERAYNDAVAGSEIYPLDRFGVGALPFDVLIPGEGRGTLRLGSRGGVIMTPIPRGFSFKRAPETPCELAEMLEKRFGKGIVIIGKAVSLIGMLAAEHVFVFHEGASGYIHRSRKMHQALAAAGLELKLNPILRVDHRPWDAMTECCAWIKLPEPLRRPFGVDELSAPSFALRWREVAAAQRSVLTKLSELRRPLELIRFLQEEVGGQWRCLGMEYERLHDQLAGLRERVEETRTKRQEILAEMKRCKFDIDESQRKIGDHWRAFIFEKPPSQADLTERERLIQALSGQRNSLAELEKSYRALRQEQDDLVDGPEMLRAKERRSSLSLEAELMRLRLIREAVIATQGLEKAGHRPSAWWFPLICSDGTWFRAAARRARFWLEPLL